MRTFTKGRDRGQWWPYQLRSARGAIIRCPKCSQERPVWDGHLDPSGVSIRPIPCVAGDCHWREHIRLEGWRR